MSEKSIRLTVVPGELEQVVAELTAPAKRQPDTITEALSGSARDVLWAMRRALAIQLDAGAISSNAIASAYKELRELDRQIRTLEAEEAQEARDSDTSAARPRRSFNASAI